MPLPVNVAARRVAAVIPLEDTLGSTVRAYELATNGPLWICR